MTDLIRPLRGAYPGAAIEPSSSIRDQLALLGKVGVRYGGLNNATAFLLLDGLIAYWTMDEIAGTRFDSTANGNDLTDNGSVGSAPGIISNAADFDSTNFLSGSPLGVTTDLSISLWAKVADLTALAGNPGLIADKDNWGGLWINASTRYLWGRITNSSGVGDNFMDDLGYQVPIDAWIHIVLVANSATGTAKIYVNANEEKSLIYDGTLQSGVSSNLRVGSQSDENIIADIDEVGIWNRALTPAEISTLYGAGSPPAYPFS